MNIDINIVHTQYLIIHLSKIHSYSIKYGNVCCSNPWMNKELQKVASYKDSTLTQIIRNMITLMDLDLKK